jgi:type IV pilus assembly protein PilC
MANKGKLSLLGISAFCESMAGMLSAGIDLSEAVSLLKQKGKNSGTLNEGVEVMRSSIEEGSTFSEAMKKSGLFPDYVLDMAEAGESTGKSEDVFRRLSDYYARQHNLSEKIRATIVYPLAMIILIIIVLYLMLKMVLPAFSNVYETLTGSLSESSFAYIDYAFLFCRIALIVMIVLVGAVVVLYFLYNGSMKKQIQKLLSAVPGFRSIMENLALYRFTSAYEVYLSSGSMQDEALEKAAKMADYDPVLSKIEACGRQMEEGHGFAVSANEAELYEPIYARMLIPAEKSGNTESTLNRLVDLLSESVVSNADRLLNTSESVLSGTLMVTVAIALLCVMLPLIGIMNSIG